MKMLRSRVLQPRLALQVDIPKIDKYRRLIAKHEAAGNGEKARRVIGPILAKHERYMEQAMVRLNLSESQARKLYGQTHDY